MDRTEIDKAKLVIRDLKAHHLKKYVGKTAVFTVNKMLFDVKVVESRVVYQQPELKIVPVSGQGSAWIRNFNKIGII